MSQMTNSLDSGWDFDELRKKTERRDRRIHCSLFFCTIIEKKRTKTKRRIGHAFSIHSSRDIDQCEYAEHVMKKVSIK